MRENITECEKIYNENGYCIAKGLLPKNKVIDTLQNIKLSYDYQLEFLGIDVPDTIEQSMIRLFNSDIDRYKKTSSTLWRKLSVYDLCHSVDIQNMIKTKFGWDDMIIPGGQVIHIQAETLRIPNGYFGLNAHQDFPSVQGSLDGLVTWIPLVDIDIQRYPLEIIPGSHKYGIFPLYNNNDTGWEIKTEYYDESDFIPVECEAGDVIFMSNFLIHRSSSEGDDRVRIACSTRYDNAREKTFIERCYPSAYVRSVHREQLFDIAKYKPKY